MSSRRKVPLIGTLILASVWSQTTPSKTVSLSGRVLGWSGRYTIYVALWNSPGFLNRPVQQVKIEPGAAPIFLFRIPPGRWAISAFEDRNGNGVLDMGWFGPKEPSGFWHPFHKWRKPRFDDVSSQIDQDNANANVELQ